MTTDTPQHSVALFGSVARGDNDGYSDRDLLIVSDEGATLRSLKSKYDSAGWSCTAYSWARLHRDADSGSLFVQHLKQESKIVSDPTDQLAQLLAKYSPRGSYKREWSSTASLVGNLLEYMPHCEAGPMWALDVLAVGFRSLAVATLADYGIYAFSNSKLLDGLVQSGKIKKEDWHQLDTLRRFKSLHRKGIRAKGLRWPDVYSHVKLVDKAFSLGITSSVVRPIDTLDMAITDRENVQSGGDWYAKCRRIESALLTLKPRRTSLESEFQERRGQLLKIVKSPNTYAWHFTEGLGLTQTSLKDLIEISAV